MVTKNRLTQNTVASPILRTGEGHNHLAPSPVARSDMGEATVLKVKRFLVTMVFCPG
jgi:hypothetical protein